MLLQRLSPPKEAGQVRQLPSRRSPMMLVASVALTALGALVAWQVYGVASQRVPVLVMARDVPIGQRIQAQDLRTVALGVDAAVQSVDATGKSTLIGKRAAVDLKAGSLLAPAHVTETLVPGPGEVVVPVALKPSRLPARGIQPGDRVVATTASTTEPGRGVPPGPSGQGGSSRAAGRGRPGRRRLDRPGTGWDNAGQAGSGWPDRARAAVAGRVSGAC